MADLFFPIGRSLVIYIKSQNFQLNRNLTNNLQIHFYQDKEIKMQIKYFYVNIFMFSASFSLQPEIKCYLKSAYNRVNFYEVLNQLEDCLQNAGNLQGHALHKK